MGTVQLAKDWTGGITPNLRRGFTSLNDLAGWWIYENTQRLSTKWTRVWESDGVAGPANAGDATQRLVNVAACSTRGANAAAAQSWGVYQASDGAQVLIAYQGGTDDVIRIGYSRLGQYTLAGVTTQQPTAADELPITQNNTVVLSTLSGDRVMDIWCIDGDWRCVVWRANAIVSLVSLMTVSPLVAVRAVNPIFTPPYLATRVTAADRNSLQGAVAGGIGNLAIGATGYSGHAARVHTDQPRNIRVVAGEIVLANVVNGGQSVGSVNNCFNADKPALQNGEGSPLLPLFLGGEKTANCDGVLGVTIDWWICYSSSLSIPAKGDPFAAWDPGDTPGVTEPRSNWLVALGSACVWPWRNVAVAMETA